MVYIYINGGNVKLSEYCDKKEKIWYEIEESYVQKFIDYLSKNIEEDLFRIANTNDSMEVFDRLKLWIFNFYNKAFIVTRFCFYIFKILFCFFKSPYYLFIIG